MKKILSIFILFLISFSPSYSRRSKFVEEIPWQYSYSINKYGEKDKIIAVECGKWAMKEKISIDNTGIFIDINKRDYNLVDSIETISFLLDSKEEITIKDNIVDMSVDAYAGTRKLFIPKEHKIYINLIKKMRTSNNMSILLEDKLGNIEKITDINNANLDNLLKKL